MCVPSLTKGWEVFDGHFLAGGVEGDSRYLQGLVGFLELLPLMGSCSRHNWRRVWPLSVS